MGLSFSKLKSWRTVRQQILSEYVLEASPPIGTNMERTTVVGLEVRGVGHIFLVLVGGATTPVNLLHMVKVGVKEIA